MIDEALTFLRTSTHRSTASGNTDRSFFATQDVYELAKPTENLIRKYPAAALATAFLVGVAIAWWVKRK